MIWRKYWISGQQLLTAVQSLSLIRIFETPTTVVMPTFLSFIISGSLLNLKPIEFVLLYNHLILCRPFPKMDFSPPMCDIGASSAQQFPILYMSLSKL